MQPIKIITYYEKGISMTFKTFMDNELEMSRVKHGEYEKSFMEVTHLCSVISKSEITNRALFRLYIQPIFKIYLIEINYIKFFQYL